MISMLLKTDGHVTESELCLAVISVMLTTLTIGIPSSCGFQHTSFSAKFPFYLSGSSAEFLWILSSRQTFISESMEKLCISHGGILLFLLVFEKFLEVFVI